MKNAIIITTLLIISHVAIAAGAFWYGKNEYYVTFHDDLQQFKDAIFEPTQGIKITRWMPEKSPEQDIVVFTNYTVTQGADTRGGMPYNLICYEQDRHLEVQKNMVREEVTKIMNAKYKEL